MLFTEITNEDKTETLVREYYPSKEDKNKIGKLMKEYTISTKNGRKNGEFKSWDPNGNLLEQKYYKNDLAEGVNKLWYHSGNLMIEQFFVKDKRHGEYKRYWSNGNLEVQTTYINGRFVKGSKKIFNEDGTLIKENI